MTVREKLHLIMGTDVERELLDRWIEQDQADELLSRQQAWEEIEHRLTRAR